LRISDCCLLAPIFSGLAPIFSGLAPIFSGLAPIFSGLAPIFSGLAPIHSGLAPKWCSSSAVRTFSVLTVLRAHGNRVGVGSKLQTPVSKAIIACLPASGGSQRQAGGQVCS